MPLSDREQQLLDQMERALLQEDPGFATSMRGGPRKARNRRRVAIGVGGVIVGLGIVLLGVTIQQVVVGAIGFALMVGAVIYALTDGRPKLQAVPTPGSGGTGSKTRRKNAGQGFMNKLEERWEQRRNEGNF